MIGLQAAVEVMMIGEAVVPVKAVVLAAKETPSGNTYVVQKFGSRLFGLAAELDGTIYCEQTVAVEKINLDEIRRLLDF